MGRGLLSAGGGQGRNLKMSLVRFSFGDRADLNRDIEKSLLRLRLKAIQNRKGFRSYTTI